MTTVLEGVEGSASRPDRSLPRKRPGTQCTGGWVGPRAGLDRCGKSRPPTGIRSPDRPARSQSLYRLSYTAHCFGLKTPCNLRRTRRLTRGFSRKSANLMYCAYCLIRHQTFCIQKFVGRQRLHTHFIVRQIHYSFQLGHFFF